MKPKVKKFFNKVVAAALSVTMFVGIAEIGVGTSVVNAADELSENSGSGVSTQNDISVNSTNSFGNLLSKEISDEDLEESETVGYKIFTAEVKENKVSVDFQTLESGTLIAAIYDEDGTKLISTGKTEVSAEDTTASITLDTNSMPKYFYLRVFLVDTTTLRPMCKVYDCPNYTKEMQEFLAKTTDDFESDSVLNFDNDKTNNFAVYSDKTNVIPESKTKNKVVSADDESGVYVFENIDSNISSLKSGDVFAYEYGDDNLIIVKVGNITINGTKATVTSQDTSMDEVFDYVKIDEDADTSEVTVDDSNLEEGITYKGMSSDKRDVNERKLYADRASQNGIARSMDLDVEREIFSEFELELYPKSGEEWFSIGGGVKLGLKPSFKLYMDNKCKFCEFNLGYSAELSLKIKGKFEVSCDLASFEIPVFTGITVAVTPKIFFEGEITVEFNTTLEGSVGGRATDTNGLENISKSPTFNPELKVEGTLFLGFALEPSINIISKYVAMIGLEAKVGVEVKATYSIIKPKEDYIHECKNCIDGEISFKMSLEMEMKLLNMDKLKFKLTLTDITIHLL